MDSQNASFLAYLEELSNGFRGAQILFTAHRLGLFAELAGNELTAGELAGRLQCDERGVRILCDALAALRLLEKRGERYRNSSEGKQFLVPDGAGSYTAMLSHKAVLYEKWGRMLSAIKAGMAAPAAPLEQGLEPSPESFAAAMAVVGRISAPEAVSALDLSKRASLLDVGGGPGIYAIEFAQRNPHLKVTILDNVETLAVAKQNVRAAGLEERVSFQPGNILSDVLPPRYDFVFASNLIHSFSPAENLKLIKNCAAMLLPGGQLCVKDFFLEPSRSEPVQAALFAVNMLVNTDGGDCYTAQEVESWMEQAGLQLFARISLTTPSGMVLGAKI